jgi:GT2 family glycosyltransferase
MKVSVCIPTHNRRADLERTLTELHRLTPPADEILVLADGCSDDTAEFVRKIFPEVRLLESAEPIGSVAGRNRLFTSAEHEIILGLDDDSYPVESNFLARLPELFQKHPRAAVFSFPQRTNEFPETLNATSFGPALFTASYVSCACALRRDVFQRLGGYPGFFFHSYEEPDYALRCLDAGWQVFHETSLTIRHHFTPVMRNEMRTHHRHARNEFWSVLLRCPAPQLFGVAFFRIVRQFGYAMKRGMGWGLREPGWWPQAIAGISSCLAARRTVSWRTYLNWMRLGRMPIASEDEWMRIFGKAP